ncbi:hypothetical protein [Neorhizobium galegae]|uniref:hypothetical protein n=1 Tax=Neorhizobium galegae TaxID=399 RepID=UPI001F34A82E|nr:hypothetical protein [Neorhizobium galegae]UIK04796.1 hypothetical protein LZK81_19345 [Neorhizobium galegae]
MIRILGLVLPIAFALILPVVVKAEGDYYEGVRKDVAAPDATLAPFKPRLAKPVDRMSTGSIPKAERRYRLSSSGGDGDFYKLEPAN